MTNVMQQPEMCIERGS